ncbi:MAG: cyanophycin synthetase [Bacteroidales bacterium]|nr:cyanophycin synthetase [Bacteroidales bacterium]
MNIAQIKAVYFIGIGGIGMSAIARYFLARGIRTGGYDRTPSTLTRALEDEGAWIHYEDNIAAVPSDFKEAATTCIIYTPAIPSEHGELCYFFQEGFEVQKRAQLLGTLTQLHRGLCVAGTHGKTSTSAMLAHLLHESHVGCNAFLGGITKNYNTNYLLSPTSDYVVIEADEFDRSFHHLRPYASVITSADPDHLDVYGTAAAYRESFEHYTSLIQPEGALLVHSDVMLDIHSAPSVRVYRYGRTSGDFYAANERIGHGRIIFDLVSPLGQIDNVELGVPISINIDNGIAAMALAQLAGATADEIRAAMLSYTGVVRRFDFKIKTPEVVLLSDYAHHPEEIRQSIQSLREVFTGRKLTGVFQPHLYSRTNDFYREFAESLAALDEVVLLDIYPARELPIEGVTSKLIYDHLPAHQPKQLITKDMLTQTVQQLNIDVLVVLGAGDADNYMPQLEADLRTRYLTPPI